MKKLLIFINLLILISCIPIFYNNGMTKPASTTTIGLSTTITTLLEVTATQHQVATATIEPSITLKALSEVTSTQPAFSVVQREYNPSEWKVIYDEDWILQIDLDSKEQMWIFLGEKVGYYDGRKWVLFSKKDYGLSESPFDMAVAPDGTVWLSGRYSISRYRNSFWDVFPIPDPSETSFPRLGIDSSNGVWLALPLCYCNNSIRIFDGVKWDEQWLSSIGEAEQLLFTPDGTLWAAFNDAIGQYNGKSWKIYSGIDLWQKFSHFSIRISSDSQGNIYGITDWQKWVVKINRDGFISKIPFDFVNYEFNPVMMRLFIDKQGRIWTNACLKNSRQGCLAYYQDNQWISFKNLPFYNMSDMKELSDGTLLVATTNGLFQYKPGN